MDVAEALQTSMLRAKSVATSERQWGSLLVLGAGRVQLGVDVVPEGVPPEPEPEPEPSRDVESLLPSLEEFLGSCKLSQYVGSLAGRELVSLFNADEAELRDAGLKQFHAKRFIRHRRELLAGLELAPSPEPEAELEVEPEQEEEIELWD